MKSRKIAISDHDMKILCDILRKYPMKFFAFGSRTKEKNRKFSDLDILVEGDGSIVQIKNELEDSNISIKIDLINKKDMDKEFYDLIKDDFVMFKV